MTTAESKSILHDGCFAPISIRGRMPAGLSTVSCVEEFPTFYRVWFRQYTRIGSGPLHKDFERTVFLDMIRKEHP